MEAWIRVNWPIAVAGAGVLLAFIGTLLPAVSGSVFAIQVSRTYIETDDGKIVLVFVLISGGFWCWRAFTTHIVARIGCLLAALIVTAVAIVDLVDTTQRVADINRDTVGIASVGAAVYLVTIGGMILVVMALVSLFKGHLSEHDPQMPTSANDNPAQANRTPTGFFQPLADLHRRGILSDEEYEERHRAQVRRLLEQGWTLNAVRHAIEDPVVKDTASYASSPSETIANLEMLNEIRDKKVITAEEYEEYSQWELSRFSAISGSSGVVERLSTLKEFHDRDLLSVAEYEGRRQRELERLYSGSSGVVERLGTLKEFHDRGLLTEAEYEERRQREVERL